MLLIVLMCYVSLAAAAQEVNNDQLDLHDVLQHIANNETIKIAVHVLVMVAIISAQLWPTVKRFMQSRLVKWLVIGCFIACIIYKWIYLYEMALDGYRRNVAMVEHLTGRCSGMKNIGWIDSLWEWITNIDPCENYHKVLQAKPDLCALLAKAIDETFKTFLAFIPDLVAHTVEWTRLFLVAPLKAQPVILQIFVYLTDVLIIAESIYRSLWASTPRSPRFGIWTTTADRCVLNNYRAGQIPRSTSRRWSIQSEDLLLQ